MPDTGSDPARQSGVSVDQTSPRRAHSYSRLTTAIAVLALGAAGYALWRLDAMRDRLDAVNDIARASQADRTLMRTELQALADREAQARREHDRRLESLSDAPKQLAELSAAIEELRGRARGPERAWSRAEALFLLELAQRRLTLERDVDTAVAALESADALLAALRDSSTAPVRQQIARDLHALRAAPRADISGVLARLASAEEQAMRAPVKGIVSAERDASSRDDLPHGMLARAWAMLGRTISQLITVREVDDRAARVLTQEEALLHRQYLQLLLFSARTAVERHDASGYRNALAGARQSLGEFFDLTQPVAQNLLQEVQRLEPMNIDPALPDISASIRALQRLTPVRPGPE